MQMQRMMRHRAAGLLSFMLVLSFSLSVPGEVCAGMSHEPTADATPPESSSHEQHSDHHSGPAPHSPASHNNVPPDDCQSASSCATVVFAADVVERSIDCLHAQSVVPETALTLSSESLDLEPPPPKA